MAEVTKPLIKYRLKPDYQNLFSNLATGEVKSQKQAFDEPGKITTKSYLAADMAKAPEHRALLKKLVDAGFVEEVSVDITYLEKE